MALPPVTVRISGNVDDLLAKVEAAKAAIDDLDAKAAESQAATKGGGLGPAGGMARPGGLVDQYGRPMAGARTTATDAERTVGTADRPIARVGADTEKATKQLGEMRQMISGQLPNDLANMSSLLKSISAGLQGVANGAGQFGKAFSTLGSTFTGPLSLLGSLAGFAKTWAIMVPTLFAAPALLGAIGGAAGGLAGSFTVLASVVGLFGIAAMKALSYVTSVSNLAQYDALSAPLQQLYLAYHRLSNEITIFSQTMGSTTVVSVLINMFNTLAVVVQRLGPLMGESASAVQSAFGVISAGLLGPQFQQFINWVGAEATPVMTTFAQTLVNFASGWTGLMEDLTPAITLFDQGMVHLTATFANWANSPKGKSAVEGFVNYVKDAWPQISHFWGGLGDIISKFFSSAAKGAPGMAQDLGNFFTVIANHIPMLVQFADSVLPGIVNGFSAFTGGFFAGLGDALKGFGGAGGVNWTQVGDTVGKITGDLIRLLPNLIQITTQIISMASWLGGLPGVAWAIVGAFVAFKAIVAAGQIQAGLSAIRGAFAGIGADSAAATASAEGMTPAIEGATAASSGLLASLGPIAAIVASMGYTWSLMSQKNQVQNQSVLNGAMPYGRPGLGATGRVSKANSTSSLWASEYSQQGSVGGSGPINIQSQNTINVAGPVSPEALQQIDLLLRQHDQMLVQRLQQTRGAYG